MFTSSRMGRAGSLTFGLRGAGDSSTTGCVFHFPFPSLFRVFVHVGIIVRLAVPGEHGHRKPRNEMECFCCCSHQTNPGETLVGSGCVRGPSLPQAVWPGGVGCFDWPGMGWEPISITSGGGDVLPLASGVRICEML